MLLWIAFALMTGLAVLAVLWPLSQRTSAPSRADSNLAVYKDQLTEIDRDEERGLIAGSEAQGARLEVARRLLDAGATGGADSKPLVASKGRARIAALVGFVLIPAVGLGVYSLVGSPELPDQPISARLTAPVDNASLGDLVARVEAHLEANPEDGEGWEVVAPVYLRAQRFADARQAYANAIRLLGSTAEREASMGEAIVAGAGGVVTAEAKEAIQRAIALDANNFRARYYIGLAAEQDGDKAAAVDAWTKLGELPGATSGMKSFLSREIARVTGAAPGPSAEDVASASQMTPKNREGMIRTMVAGLATRLAAGGGTLDEWLRLIRSYSVLGENDKAASAAADARKALAATPESLQAIDDLVKSLGIGG